MHYLINNCKPTNSLSIYLNFRYNTVEYMYIRLFETREYLSKLIKVVLAQKTMQELLQSRMIFSYAQYRCFYSTFNLGKCLFQPVTPKKTEVKIPDSERAESLFKILVDNLRSILRPFNLASQMRLLIFPPIMTEYFRNENFVSSSIGH